MLQFWTLIACTLGYLINATVISKFGSPFSITKKAISVVLQISLFSIYYIPLNVIILVVQVKMQV